MNETRDRSAMAEIPLRIGADAMCADGVCGKVSRVVVDPVARVVSHLVVQPRHWPGLPLSRSTLSMPRHRTRSGCAALGRSSTDWASPRMRISRRGPAWTGTQITARNRCLCCRTTAGS